MPAVSPGLPPCTRERPLDLKSEAEASVLSFGALNPEQDTHVELLLATLIFTIYLIPK